MERSPRPDTTETEQDGFSFDRFAELSFYRAVNRLLVDLSELEARQRVLDLACGTGAVTKLILEKLQNMHDSYVIAMDSSSQALQEAQDFLSEKGYSGVRFVQGRAQQLSEKLREAVDAVVFCNAFHLIEDKEQVVEEVANVLASEGVFAFNTGYFDGSQPRHTHKFYRKWIIRALRLLKERYDIEPSGDRATSRKQLSADEYARLLEDAGFTIRHRKIESVDMTLEGWLRVSEFRDFIGGALPGVPLDKGREALKATVRDVFEDMELDEVERRWLQMVAVR